MYKYITRVQYRKIEDASLYDVAKYHDLLEEYTGIKAVPYTAYLYYDNCGNFVGDSDSATLEQLLEAAYVEVKNG